MHLGSGTRPSLLDFELSLPGKLLRTLVLHGAAPKVVQLVVRAVPASAGEKDCFDRAPLHCAILNNNNKNQPASQPSQLKSLNRQRAQCSKYNING